jgi:prepilin-type N-terminal cleavage/methylation domain-containing protein
MKILNDNKGFTLIELMVAIAIIGILSSVALVSFSSATKSANDAKIKSGLASAIQDMALKSTDGKYSCDDISESINKTVNSASGDFGCTTSGDRYQAAVTGKQQSTDGVAWCTDTSGNSAASTTLSASSSAGSC